MKHNLDFLLSEYEQRSKLLEDSLKEKVKMLDNVNKRISAVGEKIGTDESLLKLKKVLQDIDFDPFVSDTFGIEIKDRELFSKLKNITINKAIGIKAIVGFKGEFNGVVQAYIFEKDLWTKEKARQWIATHRTDSVVDLILIERLKELDPDKQRNVHLADSIMVDEFTETNKGITFHNVVFAKEGVQKYSDGMHFKPAKELKKALDSFRGKPVVAYAHPAAKIVTSLKQQIGHIVFDKVQWDAKKNRPYGDVFVKKEKKNEGIIDSIKKKKLQDNSIGFRCDIENKSGEFDGIHYDKVQTNFFIDHLALVMQGRSSTEDGVGINAF